jgi:hypothetical protein
MHRQLKWREQKLQKQLTLTQVLYFYRANSHLKIFSKCTKTKRGTQFAFQSLRKKSVWDCFANCFVGKATQMPAKPQNVAPTEETEF